MSFATSSRQVARTLSRSLQQHRQLASISSGTSSSSSSSSCLTCRTAACLNQSRSYAAPAKQASKASSPAPEAPPSPTSAEEKTSTSAAPQGMVLKGLSILKDKADPVALPDSEYPDWLWKLLEDPSISSASSLAAETAGMTKGEARAATKRNAKLARAAQKAADKAAEKAAKSASSNDSSSPEGVSPVEGLTKESTLSVNANGSKVGAVDEEALKAEREKKRAMRKANKEAIKSRNFVSAS
ncbi:hypothetical protein IE53DRAFT_385289 [Violaceomyces palustris]|uniref:Uncharacterized protein n=1 Tax=Violaceomyces palustris TaxID=1673888 RepID=A0ACD0P2W9_9BASI|nr:hypothetical protein IE53DRAFT_385289 [Violaceomyces palustris]